MSVIQRMVRNPVASNMLMILILGGGLAAGFLLPRETFPEFSINMVTVSLAYPGASPDDIEQSICLKIEDRLAGMEGVKELSSQSREGMGTVVLELQSEADVRKVLDDVKSEVEKIDFPEDAEDPSVVELTARRHVIHVAVAGNAEERTLKELAQEIRDELNDLPEISQVMVSGTREFEITVEVSEEALRRHKLTLSKVAEAVAQSSFDLPVGNIKTSGGELSIRVLGQKDTAQEYENIVVLSKPDGTVVRLSDVATVREGFENVDVGGQFNGKPAALVRVYKTADEDSIKIAKAVREYVDRKKAEMPEGITLQTWSDMSKLIQDRLNMLKGNGIKGLMLVFVILWIFLGMRLSFWVALGIPVSILGTLLVMNLAGQSLNMMNMFALIMTLGLIVDDAIVVGENVHRTIEFGEHPMAAAVIGTRSVLMPVVAAVTTTWVAFLPLMFIPGLMGQFIKIIPITVIVALAFSLVECILILPPHLAHSLRKLPGLDETNISFVKQFARGIRRRIDAGVRWFIEVPFTKIFRLTSRYRYVTLAAAAGVLVIMAGMIKGGHIQVIGFPKVDSDTLRAQVTLQSGTPFERTSQVARQLTMAVLKINETLKDQEGGRVIQHAYALLGQMTGSGGQEGVTGDGGGHVCEVIVELAPAERRTNGVTSEQITQLWRKNTGYIPDALSVEFGTFHGGPGGKALEFRMLGPSTDYVKPAAELLKARLAKFEGVSDIRDDALPGKMEMKIRLKTGAENLGVQLKTLAWQLRDAFYGNESLKIQRGRDEIKVMVRYPERERRSLGDVENMRVRTATGAEVPFAEVAEVEMKRGYTTLRRIGRNNVINVSADVDEETANAEQILQELNRENGFFDELRGQFGKLKIDLRGQRHQMFESLNALKIWYPMALLGIYTILAALFRSYIQPVIIMVAIPFGLVGAIVGHWIVGFEVTLLSLFGIVALAGIVVNDSLVLIDLVNKRVRARAKVFQAIEEGAKIRFRPIILTTLTTVAGITPILFEKSFQAQFLKPMAVSIAFGLSFATILTLLVVPSLYLIGNDVRRALRWLRTGQWVAPEDVIKHDETIVQPDSTNTIQNGGV